MDISFAQSSCRQHILRVTPLKIGNHILAWLFATQLSRLLHGHSQIGFSGIPKLAIPACNPHLLEADYNYINQDSTYPWPEPESLGKTLLRRSASSIAAKLERKKHESLIVDKNNVYSRYLLSSNTPNLYPIRTASVGCNLLLEVASAVCNIGYLPSRCEASLLIPGDPQSKLTARQFLAQRSNNPLYVHIRAGDILAAINSLYIPLPIDMIRFIKERLNTQLVFIGQLQDSDYVRTLRHTFPDDEFFHSDSESIDFEIIRAAPQVLLSTSTFAWLAAWISKANHTIILPNIGLFNQVAAPEINLVDCNDKRFYHVSV